MHCKYAFLTVTVARSNARHHIVDLGNGLSPASMGDSAAPRPLHKPG
jgi:hypothetical protein